MQSLVYHTRENNNEGNRDRWAELCHIHSIIVTLISIKSFQIQSFTIMKVLGTSRTSNLSSYSKKFTTVKCFRSICKLYLQYLYITVQPIMDWPTVQQKLPWMVIFIFGGGMALAEGALVSDKYLSV